MRSGLRILLVASLAAAIAVGALAIGGAFRSRTISRHPHAAPKLGTSNAGTHVVSVDPSRAGNQIPAGFLGLSTEFWAVEAYAGKHPRAINPVFVQLIRNLIPGQVGVLRIGGVTTDHTWWPVHVVKRSPGLWYKLNQRRLEVMKTLADEVGARLILGITFEVDSRKLAAAEGRAMLAAIGPDRIAAFEVGNEPELYGDPYFGFYTHDGQNVTGRPPSYGVAAFTSDFARVASGLPAVPIAGPAVGAANWLADLNGFISAVRRLRVITIHQYPFEACTGNTASLSYPTIPRMLSPLASIDVAKLVVPYVLVAHARGLPLRIGEMNNVACGNPPGIPNTFAMALWVIDTLYAYAQVGVDGVNVHTWPGAVYNLFTFRKSKRVWRGSVEPEYYGLLMFAQGAPAGSRLVASSSASPAVRVWATRAADGTVRVTLLNDDITSSQRLAIEVKGASGPASLERLVAPSPTATSGVTFGGQSFGQTTTGLFPGSPIATPVIPAGGRYAVVLAPASAALLTLPAPAALP
jgi:Glycosyl hydrolase family 79 C-terminal beta domain